jgi:hypothetical protein
MSPRTAHHPHYLGRPANLIEAARIAERNGWL